MSRWVEPLLGQDILDILVRDGWTLLDKKGRTVTMGPPERLKKLGIEEKTFNLHPEFKHPVERLERFWKKAQMTPERYREIRRGQFADAESQDGPKSVNPHSERKVGNSSSEKPVEEAPGLRLAKAANDKASA